MKTPWPQGDPNDVVRSVLAQPAYRAAGATTNVRPKATLLQLTWSWLYEHIVRPLLHPIARALAGTHGVGTAIGLALIVTACGVLAFVVFRLAVAFARPATRRSSASYSGTLDLSRSAADWRTLAREAAERGDYARAIAALFSAALTALDERSIVAFDGARTPDEYRRIVRRVRVSAAASFDELANHFVYAAYASQMPDARAFAAAECAYAALEPEISA